MPNLVTIEVTSSIDEAAKMDLEHAEPTKKGKRLRSSSTVSRLCVAKEHGDEGNV